MHTMNRQCHLKLELLLTLMRIPSITALSGNTDIRITKKGRNSGTLSQTDQLSICNPPPPPISFHEGLNSE